MGKLSVKRAFSVLGRFYAFVLPHWKLILLATGTLVLYSLLLASLILLVKPVWDGLEATVRARHEGAVVPSTEAMEYTMPSGHTTGSAQYIPGSSVDMSTSSDHERSSSKRYSRCGPGPGDTGRRSQMMAYSVPSAPMSMKMLSGWGGGTPTV